MNDPVFLYYLHIIQLITISENGGNDRNIGVIGLPFNRGYLTWITQIWPKKNSQYVFCGFVFEN